MQAVGADVRRIWRLCRCYRRRGRKKARPDQDNCIRRFLPDAFSYNKSGLGWLGTLKIKRSQPSAAPPLGCVQPVGAAEVCDPLLFCGASAFKCVYTSPFPSNLHFNARFLRAAYKTGYLAKHFELSIRFLVRAMSVVFSPTSTIREFP
jgi:hypothetical protein